MFGPARGPVRQVGLGPHKYVEEVVGCGANKHRSVICTRRFSQIKTPDAVHHLFNTTPPRTKCSKGRSLNITLKFWNAGPYITVQHCEPEALKHWRPAVTAPFSQRPSGYGGGSVRWNPRPQHNRVPRLYVLAEKSVWFSIEERDPPAAPRFGD